MKKSISILLCLALIFSSFSLCFAAVSDSQAASIVSDLSTIKTTLNNIYTRLGTIMNYLYDDSHSVAYWTSAIASWMQPIYTALTSGLKINLGLDTIIAGLNEVVSSGGSTSYYPYLKYNGKSNANWLSDLYDFDKLNGFEGLGNGTSVTLFGIGLHGAENQQTFNMSNGNWRQNFLYLLRYTGNALVRGVCNIEYKYDSTQNAVNWGNLSTSSFTPSSVVDGIYNWFSAIQAPVARLSYVLASEERIEAQELAAANEQAVVDNFIDTSGDGSVPTSSFSNISGLSSGVSSNLSTDASPAQIWDIFNSDHGSWFSQETANQLDTTTRTRGSEFETPLLDQQMEEIYQSLGGDK